MQVSYMQVSYMQVSYMQVSYMQVSYMQVSRHARKSSSKGGPYHQALGIPFRWRLLCLRR